jgi:hypothetical protein
MKIESTGIKYLNGIFLGKLAYILHLDVNGFEEKESVIADDCASFNYICIKGAEESNQEHLISKLCLEIKKKNPYIKIIIESEGKKKFNTTNSIKDLYFLVKLKLKSSLVEYNNRINETNIMWFAKRNTYFLVDIQNEDEIDEIKMIMTNTNIQKQNVYINVLCNNYKKMHEHIFINSFNLFFNVDGDLFDC